MKTSKIVSIILIIFAIFLTNAATAQSWKELDSLGYIIEEKGMYDEALQIYEKGIIKATGEYSKNSENYIIAVQRKAIVLRKKGFYGNADKLLNDLIPISAKLRGKNDKIYVNLLIELSKTSIEQGLYTKAESLINDAISILKNVTGETSNEYATALSTSGYIQIKQGNSSKALEIFNQTINIRKKIVGEKHPDYATDLHNLAYAYSQEGLGILSKAESLYLQSLQIRKEKFGAEHPLYLNTLNNLADFYLSQNKYPIAEYINNLVLQIRKKAFGETHPDYIVALGNLATTLFIQNKYNDAQTMYIQEIQTKLSNLRNNFIYLSEAEKIQNRQANQLSFDNFYSFLENSIQNRRSDQDLKTLLQTALNLQLQTKGILLSETSKMRKRILACGDTTLINQFEKWQAVKNSISKAYNLPIAQREKQGIDIEKLENDANELERGLSARSEDFKEAFNPPTYTYQDIQQKLGENEVAIEMIRIQYVNKGLDDIVYLALIFTETDIKPILLKNAKELENSSFAFYKQGINLQKTDTLSYSAYWGEIEKNLPASISKIYLCPDGVYNQINLNTLLHPKTKKYLIESLDIQQVTNLKEIISNRQKVVTPSKEVLLLGYPNYELPAKARWEVAKKQRQAQKQKNLAIATTQGEIEKVTPEMIAQDSTRAGFGNLLHTKEEVETIAKLATANQWQPTVYLKDEASEEIIKLANSPRILHIATHGFFNANVKEGKEANPLLRSGLLLAGASQTLTGKEQVSVENLSSKEQVEDGILTAYEVSNLNLDKTDLVVLSACETGLGKVVNGEGIYGLQRAFMVAGAKALIISLWKVSDIATSELMALFYTYYLKSGNKRQAFASAQKKLQKTYKNPFYWGGFVMIGE
jgi:CHAT domain-containing protein